MPNLKSLFHCGRQKRDNTSVIKMLHQMSVVVVPWTGAELSALVGKQAEYGFREHGLRHRAR